MKLYEIQHINQNYNPNKIMGEELVFTHSICSTSGKKYPTEKQPKDWQHVRRLTHMLFLTWNDSNPIEPVVYLGEFYNPESDDEKFYKFFEEFNKFPINDDQKKMYSCIKNGGYTSGGRRCGSTVLLMTIAAYEAVINDKFVIYFGNNQNTADLYEKEFFRKLPFVYNPNNIKFGTLDTNTNIFKGRSNVRVIFDNDWLYCQFNPSKRLEQWSEYKWVTKAIPDFKEYSIDTH